MSINQYFTSDLPETHWRAQQHHHFHHSTMEPSSTKSPSSSRPMNTSSSFWSNSQLYRPISSAKNSPTFNFDLNNDDEDEAATVIEDEATMVNNNGHIILKQDEDFIKEVPKEPLFEKPLTPSDVGKLNRLVIPKQHAEKYFPLSGSNNNDSSGGGEKGLLLSFEDESGKAWRFRYSYWNSSQSYVLTKGWSRFVKEKRLDAGDVVLFSRHRLDADRLFIGWRRKSSSSAIQGQEGSAGVLLSQAQAATAACGGGGGGGGGWTRMYFPAPGHQYPYPPQQQYHDDDGHGNGPVLPYQPDCLHAGAGVLQNQTTATSSANSKRLRLFGVNLECQQQQQQHADHDHEYFESSPTEPPTPPDQGSSTWSSQDPPPPHNNYQIQYYHPKFHHSSYFNHQNHMDINFSRDMNQARYRQG